VLDRHMAARTCRPERGPMRGPVCAESAQPVRPDSGVVTAHLPYVCRDTSAGVSQVARLPCLVFTRVPRGGDELHGGTGLIGSQVVKILQAERHEAVPLSPSNGVDLLTGESLDTGLKGADVVLNLTNSPTFDEASADFFRTTMENLLAAAQRSGVGHAAILSIVGVDRVPDLAYYRAKVLQEEILKAGPVPYSIVRATQFFET
jgi:hypothetical protein